MTRAPSPAAELAPGDEAALWHALKQERSVQAREKLFALYANFAKAIARRRYREQAGSDIELAELCQYAYAGLLEAIDRFDPAQSCAFRPFAAHRISGSILDGIPHMNEMREQISWRRRMRRERVRSLAIDSAEASAVEQLAELALGLALGFMLEGTGLFWPGDEAPAADAPPDTAYESLAWKEIVDQLRAEMDGLAERERAILSHHYVNGMSFDQLAALLKISKGRVSQLHRAALQLLRKRMREHGHFRMIR
ncbi:MAG TPA: sigma-70 family RNA polymerase sigma factor [Rhizomicrobium sp.]|nr:sigma-70 family RNA polymerase sigma factor [Rhizomicrobium sp.]